MWLFEWEKKRVALQRANFLDLKMGGFFEVAIRLPPNSWMPLFSKLRFENQVETLSI